MTEKKAPYGKVTGKGQITIPKEIRETLGVKYGDRVDFIEKNGEIVLKRHFDRAAFDAAIEKWHGFLGPLPEGKTVDDLVNEMRDG